MRKWDDHANFRVGDPVIARVTRDYPKGYAWGCEDSTAIPTPATVYAIEGDYGIDWCCVRLSDERDHALMPSDYAHIPLDRLEHPR